MGRLSHAATYDRDERGIAYGTRVLWRRRPRSSRRSHDRPGRTGKPSAWAKLRRLTRRWITLAEGRGSEGGCLWVARLTWTGNREGTTAWRERMERCEGVDGAAVQDPCDMAKTGLFEAQFPGMEMCILRHTTPGAEPPVSGESPLLRPNPSDRWTVGSELTQGNGRDAYVTLDTSNARGIRDHLRGASPRVTECR